MSKPSAARVKILCDLSRDLQGQSSMYLAILLVSEAAARETLASCAFGNGDLDEAIRATDARLRRLIAPSAARPVQPATRRQERSRRRLRGIQDLDERIKLRALGEPLPDARRRPKEPA